MLDRLCYFLGRRLPARCWAGNRIGVRDDDAGEVWCGDCARVGAVHDLRIAARAVLDRLDYLRNLWGDEGVTRTLAAGLLDALDRTEDSDAPR